MSICVMGSQHRADQNLIEELISSFAEHEPPFSSLGTPFLVDTAATTALVQMGEDAVPQLVEALDGENPKIIMYAAYCLGLIGDQSALPSLHVTEERFSAKEPKEEYDFGIISAVRRAISRLSSN